MNLFLDKPLAFFDIEATGADPARDKIVSLYARVFHPDGKQFDSEWLFNPGFAMSDEVIAIHGITNEMVLDKPRFESQAETIHSFLRDCDLATFNGSNFDIPILWEEFHRAGITWELRHTRHIDVGNLFKKMEPRTLTSAVKFYCGRSHDDAHSASADVRATIDVLKSMIERGCRHHIDEFSNDYSDLSSMDVPELSEFSKMEDRIDLAGLIVRNKDGDAVYTHKKVRGVRVVDDPGYARWMLMQDFSENTKQALRTIFYPQRELV